MSDLFASSIAPEKVLSTKHRVHPVAGDSMEPTFRGGLDYALIAPVQCFRGDGVYLIDAGSSIELYRVSATLSGLRLARDNPIYGDNFVARDVFDDHVLGIVVAEIRVYDERFLRDT
ncbi:hypothetical protein [Rhizobium lusitanum]|uniref:hypothetical protein n=1 Tax=Rhizobium lusitanum TaxID=293958 RepID=UPI00195C06A1|nr:hypothetical protein [Rhizobium lusitanum]MBM7044074.1 hypothetical protein [Rhizobium lusitanum]